LKTLLALSACVDRGRIVRSFREFRRGAGREDAGGTLAP
jgi:hypothetical protein